MYIHTFKKSKSHKRLTRLLTFPSNQYSNCNKATFCLCQCAGEPTVRVRTVRRSRFCAFFLLIHDTISILLAYSQGVSILNYKIKRFNCIIRYMYILNDHRAESAPVPSENPRVSCLPTVRQVRPKETTPVVKLSYGVQPVL